MNYLTLENVSLSYGEKVLLDHIDLKVNQGDKIAIIARNGSGKTSMLRIIAGIEKPEGDTSQFWMNQDIKIAYLPQDPEVIAGHTVLETILQGQDSWLEPLKAFYLSQKSHDDLVVQNALHLMDEYKAWDMDNYVRELMGKFKLPDFDFTTDKLSGGQKKRLALVKVLCGKPDFLILDEPTNHLDLEMIEWLEKYLLQNSVTLLMVTHDRYFLNNVCNQIIELDHGNLIKYQGDYEEYLEKKELRIQNEATTKDKTTKLLRKELEWVRRMPKARTTKAKSRVDKYYNLKESLVGPKELTDLEIDIEMERLGTKILELHHISKSFQNKKIVDNFTYKFKLKDRVGLIGPNGSGKSTMLKIFTGQLRPDQGKVVVGDTVKFGYYEQDGLILEEDKRVIDVIRSIADYIPLKKSKKLSAEALLERFLFPRPQQQVYVSQLSGGERRRLYLLTVLIRNPNFIILDEPTNDLDLITLNVLENFLMDFEGIILIVSHDRFFMDRLVNHVFVIDENGGIRDYPGNYSDYRSFLEKEKYSAQSQIVQENPSTTQSNQQRLNTQAQKKEIQKIERELEKLNKEKKSLMEYFTEAQYNDPKYNDNSQRLKIVETRIDELEIEWLTIGG
ncbi:MAG: ABC-F family ATP-binding cassette domain-containing protein [Saprospiraceae bacterium]|nr:ABC-F family ATP-binding cassette domain-containing protein [Saprospiraceae bacterium]